MPANPSAAEFTVGRLQQALTDSRAHPIGYPILARYGYMERTANGFKAIDPDAFISRCKCLIGELESGTIKAI